MSAEECVECPVAVAGRRAFLREVGLAVVATFAATAFASPAAALASVSETGPTRAAGRNLIYPIPPGDAISVDSANDVIIARWQNRVCAFSIKCPHRGSRLEWRPAENRVFCPKHKARFQPDGSHDSGRESRDLDRYDVSRQGNSLVVNPDALRRADLDAAEWKAAVIVL
jgi:nitrite reductase/ring-hydroxylating ferredoxin subunit